MDSVTAHQRPRPKRPTGLYMLGAVIFIVGAVAHLTGPGVNGGTVWMLIGAVLAGLALRRNLEVLEALETEEEGQ